MELIAADKNTVTIKMNIKDEFLSMWSIFACVYQEYNCLDREIHNVSEEEVSKIERSLAAIMHKLPRPQ